MKKLKLKLQELNSPEVLTRQQLKNVLGGTGGVTTRHWIVKCTAKKGYHEIADGSCDGTQSGCQTTANNWCNQTEGCASCSLS